MNELKTLGKLMGTVTGSLNASDFVVFGVLGSVTDKELKKLVKK